MITIVLTDGEIQTNASQIKDFTTLVHSIECNDNNSIPVDTTIYLFDILLNVSLNEQFPQLTDGELFKLIHLCNFLNNEKVLKILVDKLIDDIKDLSIEDLRKKLNISTPRKPEYAIHPYKWL